MRIRYSLAMIFLISMPLIIAEFTLYNCTGKQLDIQFFYGNNPTSSLLQIPAMPQKSEKLLPWKLILPSFKLFKRRSFIIASEGSDNFLTFGPYWSWLTDRTFVIREQDGYLVMENLGKD